MIRAYAPGRINVIGDHTDYTGGLVLPAAIDLGTTVAIVRGGDEVVLRSEREEGVASVPLDVGDPSSVEPPWARYVAGVVAEMRPNRGARGTVSTTLPVGAGLSSSAALEVAVALALGFDGDDVALAALCQRAESIASGVPCGIMDQLASVAGVEGSLLLIDCRSLDVTPVPAPEGVALFAVDSRQERTLAGSAYAERRRECEAAEQIIGPLRDARLDDVAALPSPLRRRARHVVSENGRVEAFVAAIGQGDVARAGRLMVESHRSLRDDFDVSTPIVDDLVDRLIEVPHVHGARMTGGGFGGVVVVLADEDTVFPPELAARRVRPSAGARVTVTTS